MEGSAGQDDAIYLHMSNDEALVLFDWVHRQEEADVEPPQLVEDAAEGEVLWSISAALEALRNQPWAQRAKRVAVPASLHLDGAVEDLVARL